MKDNSKVDQEIKKLVIWRLDTIPKNFKLSIGSEGTFDKEELIRHVEEEDKIGLQIINMQLAFIKAVSSGKLSKVLAE